MRIGVIPLLLLGMAAPVVAQIGLPQLGQTGGAVLGGEQETVDQGFRDVGGLGATDMLRSATDLARDRVARLAGFVRAYRQSVEADDTGQPSRRGVILLLDPDPASLDIARRLGLDARPVDGIGDLGLNAAELSVPTGRSLSTALAQVRRAMPGKTVTADQLHFPSATATGAVGAASARAFGDTIRTSVGIIDGGVGPAVATVKARGFAAGAPSPSDHGTAVAGLLVGAGVSSIVSADVYGRDPAAGGSLAIVRALGWMVAEKVPVVSISLVGPRNPLLERAIAIVSARGTTVVAAVGNDGPAAPPAFPASYPSVLAVTGVDGRDRALIEAGRAVHLDYAAPGADMMALDAQGRRRNVRGTSFATPLVAARVAAAIDRGEGGRALRPALDAEARDLGRKGTDPLFGRGLLCGTCARR